VCSNNHTSILNDNQTSRIITVVNITIEGGRRRGHDLNNFGETLDFPPAFLSLRLMQDTAGVRHPLGLRRLHH